MVSRSNNILDYSIWKLWSCNFQTSISQDSFLGNLSCFNGFEYSCDITIHPLFYPVAKITGEETYDIIRLVCACNRHCTKPHSGKHAMSTYQRTSWGSRRSCSRSAAPRGSTPQSRSHSLRRRRPCLPPRTPQFHSCIPSLPICPPLLLVTDLSCAIFQVTCTTVYK